MIDVIEQNRGKLAEFCRKHRVKTLEVFGSAVDGTWDSTKSDLDFLLEFLPGANGRIFGGYFDFKDDLERLFGRKVDLVMPGAIRNRFFREAIDRQRRLVYAA